MDIIPAPSQTDNNNNGDPNCAAMVAGFMNILLPITEPTTMETQAHVPSLRSREGADDVWPIIGY